MRKNFGPKTFIYPQPVLIIGTYDINGTPNAMNAAWGGICGENELCVDLGKHKTTDNIAVTGCFSVSIADENHVIECDYLGLVSGNQTPDKIITCGLTTEKCEYINAPYINELPICIECELKEIIGSLYIGKIVNVSCDEKFLDNKGLPDINLLKPIVFEPAHYEYYSIGTKVGNAFKDGNKFISGDTNK